MIQIISFYYRYIFGKKMMLIYILIYGLYFFGLLYSSGYLEGVIFVDMYRHEYAILFLDEFLILTKLITVIFSVLIVLLLNRESCLDIAKYIVDRPIKRVSMVVSRLTVGIYILLTSITLFFILFFFINFYLTPLVLDKEALFSLFIGISLQGVTYFLVSFLFISIFSNIFISFVPIVLFWYMEVNASIPLINDQILLKNLYEYIPNLIKIETEYSLFNGIPFYLFTIVILVFSNVLINIKKDVK